MSYDFAFQWVWTFFVQIGFIAYWLCDESNECFLFCQLHFTTVCTHLGMLAGHGMVLNTFSPWPCVHVGE